MKQLINLPQNSRLVAVLMGFVGGVIDVYCHLELHSLVAMQTGNLILMAENVIRGDYIDCLYKLSSIIFFTLGFFAGIFVREHAKTAFWRSYSLIPLIIVSLILPLLPQWLWIKVVLMAFSTGLLLLAFTGTKIETEPYTVMMTSGNYQKLLHAVHDYQTTQNDSRLLKRKVMNYLYVVGSFIGGVFVSAFVYDWFGAQAIWLVSMSLIVILIFYSWEIYSNHLVQSDI